MEQNLSANSLNQIPQIYCAISVSFSESTDVTSIVILLKQIGISEIQICKPKHESIICLKMAIINNELFWYLNDALTKMFSKVDTAIVELKEIIQNFSGEVSIDIAFYHYGTYPALTISRENMEKMYFLGADISIDPY